MAFATTHDALLRADPHAFWGQKRIIASIATARRQEHAERLLGGVFDLVIIDEAHHLRDRSSQSWKLVDALNKRFLLLLSATPVQNDLVELYNIMTLLKPGMFRTLKEFRAAYITPGKPSEPANAERLRELMRGAMIRNTRAVVALKLPRRHAVTIKVDGLPCEVEAYADLAAAARRLAAGGRTGGHRLALHHMFGAAGSSPAAAAAAVAAVRGAPPRRHGVARPGRTLGRDRNRRQGAGAARPASSQSGREEAGLCSFPRDAGPPGGSSLERRFAFRAFRRQPQRAAEGCGDRQLPGQRSGTALHAIRRRGPQYSVLQYADQFRRAVESDGDRATHRPHRPHRPASRGIHLQSRHARNVGGANAGAA